MTFDIKAAPLWAKAVAVLVGLLLVAGLGYYFLSAPSRAREANARAETAEILGEAAQGAARDTITHYDHYITQTDRITERTERTNHDILASPGATQRLDPALDRAGRIALCLHDNRDGPVCAQLLLGHDQVDQPPAADAARPAAGR